MSSADGFLLSQPSESSTQKKELNNEQIHAPLNKLSSDEVKELTETMRSCTTEVTMTRGLPITGAILGSLYFARTRLPAQYHFGPKGWPFYAIMGIASLTASNLMFMGTCRDRIKPRIDQLWDKYNLAKSSTSYDDIRRQNRNETSGNPTIRSDSIQEKFGSAPQRAENQNPYDYTYSPPSSEDHSISSYGDSFTTYKPLIGETSEFQQPPRVRRPPPPVSSQFTSDESFISGTPSGQKSASDKNSGYSFS
uniref:OCIA domain-containing protein n=1 Tax=Caenorhabditis tropicalis TaxID=1561998 RepID=A0A1I7UY51_9PELO